MSPPAWECYCARGDFLGANSYPNHLVTHFESVSTFLSYPAPGYPGRDPPLESYLSQRRLWGGRGTSRVGLPYTGTVTMALKPPFPSLYHYSLVIRVRGLPTASPPPWSFLPMGVREWRCGHLAFESFHLGDTLLGDALSWRRPSRRRLISAMLPLGDACPWRHPHLGDALR